MHPQYSRGFWNRRHVRPVAALALIALGAAAIGTYARQGASGTATPFPPPTPWTVLAANDLGMHCMQDDYSDFMILPPYNTMHAVVLKRTAENPDIVKGEDDVEVDYVIPSNTHSADKVNFWRHSEALLGAPIPPDVGLTGNGMSGQMVYAGSGFWEVTGVPITPTDDMGRENPYPLATITVRRQGQVMARTQAVMPVSAELSCSLCHSSPGVSTGYDILVKHDAAHGTDLVNSKPVFCASCHADNALGAPGQPGVPNLSQAMHSFHAPHVGALNLDNECYACHPGIKTQCQRDVHSGLGMGCFECHGGMEDVGSPAREPWVDLPKCGDCHSRPGFEFEEPGKLFRQSRGHGGVQCIACHGSPHAITPALTNADNLQSLTWQGEPGPIGSAPDGCLVCHGSMPADPFPHRFDD